jgi:hypothetical protein
MDDILDINNLDTSQNNKRAWRSAARPRHLMLRLTEEEYSEITRRAKLARLSAAHYLTLSGLHGRPPAMHSALPLEAERREDALRALYELRRVGVTLNALRTAYQAARMTGAVPPMPQELAHAITEVGTVICTLVALLKERL